MTTEAAPAHAIAWIDGKYRTAGTALISVRDADGRSLNSQRICENSESNPDADTRGEWRECLVGIDENTLEVLKVASVEGKTLFEVLPPRPAPYGRSVKYQCAGGGR